MKNFRFVQISDIHIGSPYSYHYQPSWVENFEQALKQIEAIHPKPEFILLTGDMTRDGNTHFFELKYAKEWLERLPYTIYAIPGNHDVGNRPDTTKESRLTEVSHKHFLSVFEKDYFSFQHQDIQFVSLNSFLFGSGLVAEQEQWVRLEEEVRQIVRENRRNFWFMHTLPFYKQPFEDFESVPKCDSREGYKLTDYRSQIRLMTLLKLCKAEFIACGHIHSFDDRTVDGIRQITAPSTAFITDKEAVLGFLVYDVTPDDTHVSFQKLEVVSTTEGYGGGIENISKRNYGLAQKQSPEITAEIEALKARYV